MSLLRKKLAQRAERAGMARKAAPKTGAAKPATKKTTTAAPKPATGREKLKAKLKKAGVEPKQKSFATRLAAMKGGDVLEIDLMQVAEREYYEYGVAVIEDRAIFSAIDGLKPVTRRSLYAIHELGLHSTAKRDKSAKAVGATLGNYHPHGDSACYEAMVTAASKVPIRMIDGEGNWGTMTEGAAAMRYTNLKLSKFSDAVFFDKFYVPTIDYVPNYDGSRMEPLILPALLPNAVLNGNFGIAPGVNTRSPMFTLESVAKVLQKMIEQGGGCTPEMCMELEFTTSTGGKAVRTKANKADFLQFFKTGKGRVMFTSTATPVDKNNSIRFNQFAPISDMQKVMASIEDVKGVMKTLDDSDEKDPYKTAFIIQFVKTLKGAALDTAVKQVNSILTNPYTYDVKVTDRFVRPNGQAGAKLRSTTIPQILEDWLTYRVSIEKKACEYWMVEAERRIAYLELMRLAISKLDVIIKHVKNSKLDDAGLVKAIMRDLKIDEDQANQILSRNLRQLRHLEDAKLVANIKDLQKEIKGYAIRIKKPMAYISTHIESILDLMKPKTKATAKK